MSLDPLHEWVARIAFDLPQAQEVASAGGHVPAASTSPTLTSHPFSGEAHAVKPPTDHGWNDHAHRFDWTMTADQAPANANCPTTSNPRHEVLQIRGECFALGPSCLLRLA